MPETGANYTPRPLDEVASDPLSEAFAALLALNAGRVVSGLALTYDGLTAHIAPGQAIVLTDDSPPSANYVRLTAQVDEALVNGATNYVYLNATADIIVNQTGIQPANSIPLYEITTAGSVVTDVETVWTSLLDIAVPVRVASLDAGGQPIANVADPVSALQAVNYQTLLAIAASSGLVKLARAATTAALPANTYSAGVLTATANGALAAQDGVTLLAGERLLVKDEASALKNGVYTVTQVGSGGTPYILTRATDYDTSAEILPGTMVTVAEGTTLADSLWMLTANAGLVVGTTALTYVRKDVTAHAAETAIGIHGSATAPTASTLVHRDANSRSQVEEGAADKDITNLKQVQQVALFQAGLYGGM